MGLTIDSTGSKAKDRGMHIPKVPGQKIIALAGNPNVGKSTVFNQLTGMKQHTGNWPGKTVSNAWGYCSYQGEQYILADIPGAYSLMAVSAEEEVARDFICFGGADAVIVVCDATCLERNLNLVMQIAEIQGNVILCLNLMDEAKKKNIKVDFVKKEILDRKSETGKHQGVIAQIAAYQYAQVEDILNAAKEKALCERLVADLKIKISSLRQAVQNLSGGNQQKVVLAKCLATECDILMIDEPTRGIDVGAKQEIYKIMRALADSGKSIIMVSSEMPELIGMSDRIMVMRDGKIAGELYPEDYSQEAILNYASL